MGGPMKREKNSLKELTEVKIISTGYTRPGSHNAEEKLTGFSVKGGKSWKLIPPAIATFLL